MDSGYYAAYTGLLARNQALDSAASNLANANTNGFRAERDFFRNTIAGPDAAGSTLNRTINDYGVLGGNRISLRQGPLVHTGNPLDAAIEGQGFFAVQTAAGVRYTRNGAFRRSPAGLLVTDANEPVLDQRSKPIPIPSGPISIGSDGVLSYEGAALGRLGLFVFPSAASLVPEGAGRYRAQPGIATAAKEASVHQGMLESSNQDVIEGSLQLMLIERQAGMMRKALTMFDNDFDRAASEELPRV